MQSTTNTGITRVIFNYTTAKNISIYKILTLEKVIFSCFKHYKKVFKNKDKLTYFL